MLAASAPTPARRKPARSGELLPPIERRHVRLRLWLPITPLFWLLSPLGLLLAPFFWVWLPARSRPARPFAAAIALGGVLVSLSGVVVDVDAPGARLLIRIF